jgi:hypothetical protein
MSKPSFFSNLVFHFIVRLNNQEHVATGHNFGLLSNLPTHTARREKHSISKASSNLGIPFAYT